MCRHVYGHQDGENKGKIKAKLKKKKIDPPDLLDTVVAPEVERQFGLCKVDDQEDQLPPKPTKLSTEAMINVACDKIASGTSDAMLHRGSVPATEVLTLLYPGSKALLRIGDEWVTSRYKKTIYRARRTDPMCVYCNARYKWQNGEFDHVSWKLVGTARRGLPDVK